MANEPSSALPPLQRSSVWKFKLLRTVLLGTADKGSILARLPKGDGVLDILLGPLVVYYELQANDVDLHESAQEGTLTHLHTDLVACFAPDRVHEGKGWSKKTPLHDAAMKGHSEAVQLLLTAKANADAETSSKKTPLHDAAMKGHSEAVQLLLTAKANADAEDSTKYTPLHFAAANGQSESVQLLLTAKANPNAEDSSKSTPLHYAAGKGQHESVQLLLTAKANPNAEDLGKRTPLQNAQQYGHSDCVELLSK